MAKDTTGQSGESLPRPSGSLPTPKIRRGGKAFFKDVQREMKKVTWPTRAETHRLTGVVLGVCGLVVVFLTVMSMLFDTLINLITKGTA